MDNVIQFIANYDDWVAIKKLKIDDNVDAKMIMEFLASLSTTFDRKIESNLKKILALDELDKLIMSEVSGLKGEEGISKAIKTISGVKASKIFNQEIAKLDLQKNEQKELVGFCKTYALRKALNELGLMVDYSKIEIPGMKKVKKKKVK